MLLCCKKKEIFLKKYRGVFILWMVAITPAALASKTTTHIGDSYFQRSKTKSSHSSPAKNIIQFGAAAEESPVNAGGYLFMNQLLPNHIHYELRAYAARHYITRSPPVPPIVPEVIPVSSERNLMGAGGIGILGYNIVVGSTFSFLPFVRLQAITNNDVAYADSFGNKAQSITYSAFLGGKLSMLVKDFFAVYIQYYAGYQYSLLSGRGVFLNQGRPTISAPTSVVEFGMPYKISKSWSLTPYIQLVTVDLNPNQAGRNSPYSISQLTSTPTIYAIKLGYTF